MAAAALKVLNVPQEIWGEAVSSRPIRLLGAEKPWNVTIATVTDSAALIPALGEDLRKTVVTELSFDALVDIKTHGYKAIHMEVEIGVTFDYLHFQQIGKKGKILVTDNNRDGHILTVAMTQNERHWPYSDPQWQAAASHYAREHVLQSLTAGVPAEKVPLVSVTRMSETAVRPLNTLVKKQSSKGVEVHFLVKGVAFCEDPEDDMMETMVAARPVSLRAAILDGGLSQDGMTPSTGIGPIKIRFAAAGDRVKGGVWYPPALVKQMVEQAAAAGPSNVDRGSWGSQAGFASLKTQRRAEQRAEKGAGKRAEVVEARRAYFRAEDGEHSDGKQSTASGVSEAARALARSELDADLR
jgi:hypothetical protein